jgi:hypothetical protein
MRALSDALACCRPTPSRSRAPESVCSASCMRPSSKRAGHIIDAEVIIWR